MINAELLGIAMARAVVSDDEDEDSYCLLGKDGSETRLNFLRYVSPGDRFSVLYSSMMNFVKNIQEQRTGLILRTLDQLENIELSVGVVFSPACVSENDWRFDILFSVADCIDGVIFNGHSIVDRTGSVLIDADGFGD